MPQDYLKYENEMQDGRRKLSDEQRIDIRKEYAQGNTSWLKLAKKYGVNKGTIGLIVSEVRQRTFKEYNKGRWKIYYDKGVHNKAIKKYRDKKRKLGLTLKATR
jgi:transposase-like protein